MAATAAFLAAQVGPRGTPLKATRKANVELPGMDVNINIQMFIICIYIYRH
jgi:hypothetical protein